MRARIHLIPWLLLATCLPTRGLALEWQTDLAAHVMLAEVDQSWGAATDLVLSANVKPVPQLALGIEGAVLLPLPTSGEEQDVAAAFRVNPAAWLLFGDGKLWSYFKLGCGVDSHLKNGSLDPGMVLVAAFGLGVAPRDLKFHFGFEISGELDILGEATTRTVGLGGFLGLSF